MYENNPIVVELKKLVEFHFGRSIHTTNDFEALAESIGGVGATTLKRLWGYINNPNKLRISTLDQLAVYAGFNHFQDFCSHIENPNTYSDFFTTKKIDSKSLDIGDMMELGWSPSRYIVLKKIADNLFTVEDSINSKLDKGDVVEASCFMLGQPLYMPSVTRNGVLLNSFIAAKDHGVKIINKL